MPFLEKSVIKILKSSGWYEGRNELAIEAHYREVLGDNWLPVAVFFVRNFGGLAIHHKLWVYAEQAVLDLRFKNRVERVVNCKACPVASSGYFGEGCAVWIDENERFYCVDGTGMAFVGQGVEEALNVILLCDRAPDLPIDIKDALEAASEL